MPEPMNLFGALVGFRQISEGSETRPILRQLSRMRAWLLNIWNSPPMLRTASPMLMQAMPPGTRSRSTWRQVGSSERCMRSKAPRPSPEARAAAIEGSAAPKAPSHISIMG